MSFRPARDSALIAARNLRVLRKNPGRMIYPLVQPLVLLVMFVSVFGNLALTAHAAGASGTYRQFLIPGMIIENAALTAPTTGLALLRDASSGLADRFRALPMCRAAVLAGRLASDALVFATQALLLLAVARLLGFRVQHGVLGVAGTVGVTVVFALGVAVLSAWLALLIDDPETAERVLFFPAIALAFISSAFAPLADLAGWMQPLARANPVTAAAAAIRSLASGGPVAVPLAGLGCWTAALVLIPGFLAARRWNAPPANGLASRCRPRPLAPAMITELWISTEIPHAHSVPNFRQEPSFRNQVRASAAGVATLAGGVAVIHGPPLRTRPGCRSWLGRTKGRKSTASRFAATACALYFVTSRWAGWRWSSGPLS